LAHAGALAPLDKGGPDWNYTPYSMEQVSERRLLDYRERREERKAALRHKIMNAAAELFATEGYESVSMRKIAQRIGYTPMSIYLHFKDKADLLDCICEEAFAELYRRHERVDATVKDPTERLKAGMRTFIEFALKYPPHYHTTFIRMQRKGEAMPRRDRICARTAALKRRQVAAFLGGGVSEQDIEVATQVVMTAENGVAAMLVANPNYRWIERTELIEAVTETVVKGLRK
jgi:AcrR family transcriptional regulator